MTMCVTSPKAQAARWAFRAVRPTRRRPPASNPVRACCCIPTGWSSAAVRSSTRAWTTWPSRRPSCVPTPPRPCLTGCWLAPCPKPVRPTTLRWWQRGTCPRRCIRCCLPKGQLSGLRRAVRGWVGAGALPAALGEDLQITLGEAAANAVEHAYAGAGKAGEFTYLVTRCSDGAIEVEVRDFGRWRPERASNFHRGRGLVIIREIGVDVVVEPTQAGTEVRFRLPAPPSDSEPA